MMELSIREIAEACGGKLILRGENTDAEACVSSVVINSGLVEPQGVFLATVGERVDGHKFIPAAFAQGALLAVTQKTPEQVEAEQGCLPSDWGSYVLVADTLQALKDIAEFYRKKLSLKVVGITGSVGKTSTKEFIAGVLAEKYRVLKTEGNYNNEIGVPLTLLRIRREHEVAVVEMGISDFGEMHRLSKMARPDVCVITNIGQSHLNNLKDRDGILRAKSEIFDYMAEDGEVCLNGEDDKLIALETVKGHRTHFFGLGKHPGEEVSMVDIAGRGLWGSDARLLMTPQVPGHPAGGTANTGDGAVCTGRTADVKNMAACSGMPVHIPLPGEHMVLNAAAAACAAWVLGLNLQEIAAGIAKVTAVGGRTNILKTDCYTLIDDCYNANPASVRAAVDLLAMADTEKVAILGDMLNLGEKSDQYHAEVGRRAAILGIDRIFCVGEESRHMCRAAEEYGEKTVQTLWFPDTDALLKGLAADCAGMVPEGSTVLIKASHDVGFARVLEFFRGR